MKKIGLIFAVLLLAVSMVSTAFADVTPTAVNGKVFSGDTTSSPVVEGAVVHVTCGTATPIDSDPTDDEGYFLVAFNEGGCVMNDPVTACVGTHCGNGTIGNLLENPLYITGVDIFNVPEFGIATAMLALVGATLMFVVIRKRN